MLCTRMQSGQSSLEGVIVLPIFLFLAAAGVQLIWLLLAKHILLTATSYVALYAATAPEDEIGQQLIFQQRIKPVQRDDFVVPKIRLITPEAELTRKAADYNAETDMYAFDPEFVSLQLQERLESGNDSAEEWLQLSNVRVEIEWCFRIRVPGMGVLLRQAFNRGLFNGGTGCETYDVLKGGYYMPLRAGANTPLHTKRQWRIPNS